MNHTSSHSFPQRSEIVFFGLIVALGIFFRLVWLSDMEYKADEAWSFTQTKIYLEDGQFSRHGMPTSQKVLNPGMSIWAFYGLGWLSGTDSPVNLTRMVALSNCLALLILLGFAWKVVPEPERLWWLWGVAFLAVNPFGVMVQRKIWPPSILLLPMALMIIAWWYRHKPAGAFFWGLLGLLMGQIHLSVYFLMLAMGIWTVILDRKNVRWSWLILGAVLGMLPMIPWLLYLPTVTEPSASNAHRLDRPFEGTFWIYWFGCFFGLGFESILGDGYADFLRGPTISGWELHLPQTLYTAMAVLVLLLVLCEIRYQIRNRFSGFFRGTPRTATTVLTQACFLGYGLILTLTLLPVHRHYLVTCFPLHGIWLAAIFLPTRPDLRLRRWLLAGFLLCNVCMTIYFLWHIHTHGGALNGEYGYGPSYRVQ